MSERLFVFAIGGSGERVLRSFTMMLASGATTFDGYDVYPIIIDYDSENGDKKRIENLLDVYDKVHNAAFVKDGMNAQSKRFFAAKLCTLGNQNSYVFPFNVPNSNSFKAYIGYDNLTEGTQTTKSLLGSLYNSSELDLKMDQGFLGKPNLGSVVLHQIKDAAVFQDFKNAFKPSDGDKVVVIGSLFGGTGAAGIPEIVKAIKGIGGENVNIATILVLPYFAPNAGGDNAAIQHKDFNSKTKVALNFYKDSGLKKSIDKVYYVGDPLRTDICYSEGNTGQKNNANLVDLIAAMMIEHYVEERGGTKKEFAFSINADITKKGRFFVHNFDENTRENVLNHLVELAIALKFIQDKELTKNSKTDFRRLLNLDAALGGKEDENNAKLKQFCDALKKFYGEYETWLKEMDFKGDEKQDANSHRVGICDMDMNLPYSEIVLKEDKKADDKEGVLVEVERMLKRIGENKLNADYLNTQMNLNIKGDAEKNGYYDRSKNALKDGSSPEWVFADILYLASVDGFKRLKLPGATQSEGSRNFFTNENTQKVQNKDGKYGIIPHSIRPSDIDDTLLANGSFGAVASSMPSPMARLFLFSAALREVNVFEKGSKGDGHNKGEQIQEDGKKTKGVTPYHYLVSEMLDMLEFVFKYGSNDNFKVQEWNLNTECDALNRGGLVQHKQLATALNAAFEFDVLKGNTTIYLFKWNEKVIGGTSPVTLVYTSANLHEAIEGEKFTGDEGNILFGIGQDRKATPLHERSKAFQEYLYRLYHTALFRENQSLGELSDYILDSATNYHALSNSDAYNSIINKPGDFKNVNDLETELGFRVTVGNNVTLKVSDRAAELAHSIAASDYILKPTVNCYKRGDGNKKVPMILSSSGIAGLTYVDRQWNHTIDKIPDAPDKDIYNRSLPSLKVKYPYLTVADFFEDKVIQVGYNINKDKFFTGCTDDISFLLPLRKIFFDYFKPSDLKDNLVMTYNKDNKELTVELTLPLAHDNNTICLKKKYKEDNMLKCLNGENTFDLAVFPFYRLQDTDKNMYNVVLGWSVEKVSMAFFKQTEADNEEIKTEEKQRTQKTDTIYLNTKHISVNDAFIYAELTVNDVRSIVLPKFKSTQENQDKKFLFSIDFGTTNTHVCYAEDTTTMDVKSFDYSKDHMVMFNDANGAGDFPAFKPAICREFVPEAIGNGIKFPMRTVMYQDSDEGVLQTFLNVNIGFNYSEDLKSQWNKRYKTNIKWSLEPSTKDRMTAYFIQMLWMMKNKSVLEGGSTSVDLVVTYPISMNSKLFSEFKDAWETAKINAKCGDANIKYLTESVAPYYSYHAGLKNGQTYVNMDIGGGSTDFLYVNPNEKDSRGFSVVFAANDLWNDIDNDSGIAKKDNGFLEYYKAKNYLNKVDEIEFNNVCKGASTSEDVISYLFANDAKTKATDIFKASGEMIQLPIIHFSALVFYLAYAVHMSEVEVPSLLTFTGMGSKYIKLISGSKDDISKLVNAIFRYAGGKNVLNDEKLGNAKIEVSFVDKPKEVTATGALLSLKSTKSIVPAEDIYLGYEGEDPERTKTVKDLTDDVKQSVMNLFTKFTSMFDDENVRNTISSMSIVVKGDVVCKLKEKAKNSFEYMKEKFVKGVGEDYKLNEPMFFWPLKVSLYEIGKEIVGYN